MHKPNMDSVFRASRRSFLKSTAAASAFAVTPIANAALVDGAETLPPAFSALKSLGSRVHPITAGALAERGVRAGRLGVEETAAFTFFDHLRAAAPGFECVSADALTIACRGRKSEHELELMRLACEATCDVFRAVFASLKEGMSQDDIGRLVETGFSKMGLHGGALVLLGASAALPHGTVQPQKLREGDVVLIDGGCAVDGYQADVTRTGVFGKPSEKVARVYEIVRKAQDAALDAAHKGKFSGTVDDAARKVITDAGYGPGYKLFTHRLGDVIWRDGQ